MVALRGFRMVLYLACFVSSWLCVDLYLLNRVFMVDIRATIKHLCFNNKYKLIMSRSVPEKWLPYKAYGDVIKGTKIVAFKVPLKETVANNLQPDQRFTPKILLEAIPRIKYVIDLTNTHRYYDQREFTDAGLKYLKIMVPGRLVPPPELVKRFFKAMDDFMATSDADALVGVHCTHGVNRTGYFICRYLIQQCGWENQEAIEAFQKARGYPIERDVYVNDLKITPKGAKLDTKEVTLEGPPITPIRGHKRMPKRPGPYGGPMGPPPGFHAPPHRGGFPNGRPFRPPLHDHFGFGPPGFSPARPPMPPMPPMPPPPPPLGVPYGPRPHRYGLPPCRGFPSHRFPPRMPPGPPRMPMPLGPPRLARPLGPPGPMGPPGPPGPPGGPRLPLHRPPQPIPPMLKAIISQKKKLVRNGGPAIRNLPTRGKKPLEPHQHHVPRIQREQDFTADTFEENLATAPPAPVLAAIITGQRRRNRGRFGNRVSRGK